MPGFSADIKLGPIGEELIIDGTDTFDNLRGFQVTHGNAQAETVNVNDETKTTLHRRHQLTWAINAEEVSEELMWAFKSLNSLRDQELAFIYADDWQINSEPYLTDGLTTVTMKTNPFLLLDKRYDDESLGAIITISGVWDRLDMRGAQTGPGDTDFFISGSYNRQTFQLTLGSSPGPIGTEVFINWTYKGALVKLAPPGINAEWSGFFHPTTGVPTWTLDVALRGI